MKVKLLDYRSATKKRVGTRHYLCEDKGREVTVRRNFDESGNLVAECIEDRDVHLVRCFKDGQLANEEIGVGFDNKDNFSCVRWESGIPVQGYALVTDKRKVNVVWDRLDEEEFRFMDSEKEKYLNVPSKRSNITNEEAKKEIGDIVANASMKKAELLAISQKIPEKMGIMCELVTKIKTFLKSQIEL